MMVNIEFDPNIRPDCPNCGRPVDRYISDEAKVRGNTSPDDVPDGSERCRNRFHGEYIHYPDQ